MLASSLLKSNPPSVTPGSLVGTILKPVHKHINKHVPEDFYDLFDVEEDASKDDIGDAYRTLIREYHPDNNDDPKAKEQFKTIQAARDTLLEDRDQYDAHGHARYVRNYVEIDLDGFEFSAEIDEDVTQPPDKETVEQTTDTTPETQSSTPTNPGTGTADAAEDIMFKPNPHPKVVKMCWVVLATLVTYLIGIANYIRDNGDALQAILAEGLLTSSRSGLESVPTTLGSFLSTPTTDPLAVFLLIGIVFLPVVIGITIVRFANRNTVWGYVFAATVPLITIGYEATVSPLPLIVEVIAYLLIPLLATLVFLWDIIGRVILLYIRYYRET